MKWAQLRFHFGRKCLAIRHRLLTEFFPPIESARQESNRAHGSLERARARPALMRWAIKTLTRAGAAASESCPFRWPYNANIAFALNAIFALQH